jgi:hypothetical protein
VINHLTAGKHTEWGERTQMEEREREEREREENVSVHTFMCEESWYLASTLSVVSYV